MEQKERPDNKLTIDKDAQINVVVNRTGDEEDTIDLGRVFHNFKMKRRIYAWVLVLCLLIGAAAPLAMYAVSPPALTASSVVTLKYEVEKTRIVNGREETYYVPVTDLTAPDGEGDLNLNMITSSYVLQQAMSGLTLSQPITLAMLRANVSIERVLTDESRRAQELASQMVTDKNAGAYEQIENIPMTYAPRFVVRLKNGFGDEDDKIKLMLEDDELRMLLDRILIAYNDYLVLTFADVRLPDDEISVIDTEHLDLLESLELLRTASDDLLTYCEEKSETVRAYRSSRTGRSLNDWMQTIQTGRNVSVDYLYSYVYNNSIVRDKESMITSYRYQLRTAETQLATVNENTETVQTILDNYKNDEIFVSMQDSDSSKSTSTTTDYYNELMLQQTVNYEKAAKLEITIADLRDKIANLTAEGSGTAASEELLAEAEAELEKTMASCREIYEGVRTHMEELFTSPFYTTYAEHTVPQDRLPGLLSANLKKIIIGAVAGAVIACGIWFLAALAPEFRRGRKDEEEKAGKASAGKEAAE